VVKKEDGGLEPDESRDGSHTLEGVGSGYLKKHCGRTEDCRKNKGGSKIDGKSIIISSMD